jgi:release factor glutamine methyltransferase
MTIDDLLYQTTKQFAKAGIPSARLDAQVLIADALNEDRSWLLAHLDDDIPRHVLKVLRVRIAARAKRMPLAYVRGHQEFYGRNFVVNPRVLIPRPETEQLIAELKGLKLPRGSALLDVGTGSGAIAVTAAHEAAHLLVEACDISLDALDIARANAERLNARIERFFISNLLDEAGYYDVIAANLPYVGPDWLRSPETNYEPGLALFADNQGLALIHKLLEQAPSHLRPDGYLLLEADPRQFDAIIAFAPDRLVHLHNNGYILTFQYKETLLA